LHTSLEEFLAGLAGEFSLSPAAAREVVAGFHGEMERGLGGGKSSLKMLPSFVRRPRGDEQGGFLALDLGGTNVRILAVSLEGEGRACLSAVGRFTLPREIMTGPGEGLFDFLAGCIGDFSDAHRLDRRRRHELAFIFSFPVEQLAIASGRLIAWTKGFAAGGVEGREVVGLLRAAIRRRGLGHIHVVALANDTVGTLMAASYADPACDMGVILGTGTNACYPEKTTRLRKCPAAGPEGEMIVNMEWGNFDLLPVNAYDRMLDRASLHAGRQRLEKMVSGMYLGELVRLVIQEMISQGLLFREADRPVFAVPYGLSSEHMALASGGDDFFRALGIATATPAERRGVAEICRLVATRAARLAGTAIAAVVTWMDPALTADHTVAIDGSLFEKYPGFQGWMREILAELLEKRAERIKFILSRDGSGIGAAIIAAVAASMPGAVGGPPQEARQGVGGRPPVGEKGRGSRRIRP